MDDYANLIDMLLCSTITKPDFMGVLAAGVIEDLVAERKSFYATYRMKCDAETKFLEDELAKTKAELEVYKYYCRRMPELELVKREKLNDLKLMYSGDIKE